MLLRIIVVIETLDKGNLAFR